MMEKKIVEIDQVPAIIYGAKSSKVFLFVHGQNGYKEEAERFAEKATAKGWQVLSVDLPEHGQRKSERGFVPWIVVPELQKVWMYMQAQWDQISLRANSIGAWFSMLAFADKKLEQSLFVSPILDMKQLIENMMRWANVSEERLEQEQIIQTNFGQELSWEYLIFAQQQPIDDWKNPTAILYGDKDDLTERALVEQFSEKFHCKLTVMEQGEHWFHTEEQLAFMDNWLNHEMNS